MEEIPEHIAIIMDGNGRWAKKRGASRIFGHQNAIQAVRETVERCAELHVDYLTLFAFSTENWSRPQREVDGLMSLLVSAIKDELPTLLKNNVRLHSIGDIGALPNKVKKNLEFGLEETKGNTGLTLILALNYSGRWDIENAFSEIAKKIEEKKLRSGDIRDCLISEFLSTRGIPDPELLIRTSGEQRISNFYLWQSAYTELHYTDVLWPDFRKSDLEKAIKDFQNRERRFGKISEQAGLK